MTRLRRTWRRLIGAVWGASRDDELSAEIESHVQMHADDYVRRGVTPDEARRLAVLRLGGVESVKEAYRDQRGLPFVDAVAQDLRYTGRLVRRHPAFYLALVGILGSTLGLGGIIFSVAHAILLRPFPYGEPNRLVRVGEVAPNGRTLPASSANAASWAAARDIFEDLALVRGRTFELGGGDVPERIQSAIASANFLDVLRVRPLLGRAFEPGEDRAGRSDVLLLSYDLWMRRFGGRPEIVGQRVPLDGRPQLVIGVLRPDFEFPAPRGGAGERVELIAPIDWTPRIKADRGNRAWRVIARLKPDVSVAQAQHAMDALGAQLAREYETNRRWGIVVERLADSMFGRTTQVVSLLLAAVAALLVVGCANVANLLLARGIARRREFVVRTALGGSAGRLTRQVLTESLVLAGAGAVLGVALARAGLPIFLALAPNDLPRREQISMDAASIAITCLAAVITALFFGALPAWYAGRTPPGDALRASGRGPLGRAGRRLQSSLVVGQMAMTVVLLVGAGLLLRSAMLLQQAPIGFEPHHVITARVVLDEDRYPGDHGRWTFLDGVLGAIAALPGVEDAGAVSHPPLVAGDSLAGFYVEGRPIPEPGHRPGALRYSVSPTYFSTLGIPLLAGRAFTSRDRADAPPVVIVNDLLARTHLAGQDPIGARLRITGSDESVEVVGVVGDTKHYGLDVPMQEQVYRPYAQAPSSGTTLLVKTALAPDAIVPAIRRVVAERDRHQPVSDVVTVEQAIRGKTARSRLTAGLLSAFAMLALILAAAGVFATVSYLVGQRTSEMGLRLALGARRSQVLGMILAGGLRMALLGVMGGLAIAWSAARSLQSLVFGVTPHDAPTFAIAGTIVLTAALLACVGPALRAASVDPSTALRAD